jgi:TetR/AcrR family transcriptional regulator, regulator of autoinduction and epiphytic fitness
MAPTTSISRSAMVQTSQNRPHAEAVTTSAVRVKPAVSRAPHKSTLVQGVKPSFKQQMLLAREEAIIEVVNSMLANKGFDAMTVDEVAAQVGVAKASLYKHFPSKEDLAAAAMARMMERAREFLAAIEPGLSAVDKLKAVVRWMLQLKLNGQMPNLPSQNSSLRATLTAHRTYVDNLMEISDQLGAWIEEAQKLGHISKQLPAIVVMYTLYARACDPVLEFLKTSGLYDTQQMLDMVTSTCFDGLVAR